MHSYFALVGTWRGNLGKHSAEIPWILHLTLTTDSCHLEIVLYFEKSKQRRAENRLCDRIAGGDKRVWSPQCGMVYAKPDGTTAPVRDPA